MLLEYLFSCLVFKAFRKTNLHLGEKQKTQLTNTQHHILKAYVI